MLFIVFFYENEWRNDATEKILIAFFMHLQIIKIREFRKMGKITKRRKMSFLLNKRRNI